MPQMQLYHVPVQSYQHSSFAPVASPSQPAFSQPSFQSGENTGTFRKRGNHDINAMGNNELDVANQVTLHTNIRYLFEKYSEEMAEETL